jgi:hypothetical protein
MGQEEDCKSFDALQLKKWNRNSIKKMERDGTEEGRKVET